jgi:hypothetical protein
MVKESADEFDNDEILSDPNSPATRTVYIKTETVGTTGVESYAGYPKEEYLEDLRGSKRAKVFDKMWRSDSQSKMLYNAVVNIIKSATWEIEATPDSEGVEPTEEQKADRDLINHILFKDTGQAFSRFLSDAMTFVKHGHAAVEKTYKLVLDHPTFGTYHGIEGLDLISPKTIERFNLDKESGGRELESITQQAFGDVNASVDIDADYLIMIVLDQEGGNFEGVSMFRPIYGNYYRKNFFQKINAIGIERFAVPSPIITVPPGFQERPEFAALLTAVENFCSGQSNFLTVPEGVTVVFERNVYDPQKVEEAIEGEDRRAAKAFLANFLELGMKSGGSFSLSADLSDFFLGGLKHIAQLVCDAVNTQLIPELILINRGTRSTYPRLVVSAIDDKAGKELADVLGTLIDKKVIIPDDQLEINMRKRFGFPKKSTEGQRDVTPPSPFGAAPTQEKKPGEPAPKPGEKAPPPPEPKPSDKVPPKQLAEAILRRIYG